MAQTSVRFPRTLLKRARIRAATDEVSLQALLISALDAELERRDKLEARKTARKDAHGDEVGLHIAACLTSVDFVTSRNDTGREVFSSVRVRARKPWPIDRHHDSSSRCTAGSAVCRRLPPSSAWRSKPQGAGYSAAEVDLKPKGRPSEAASQA